MELKPENRKVRNAIIGVISCLAIILAVCIIIGIGNKTKTGDGNGNQTTVNQGKAEDESASNQTGSNQQASGEQTTVEPTSQTDTQSTQQSQSETSEQSMQQSETPEQSVQQSATSTQSSSQQQTTPPQSSSQQPSTPSQPSPAETIDEKVNRIVSEMTLEEKVYQMLIVTPEALTGKGTVTQAGQTTKDCINKYPVGGIIYFASNIVNESQITAMLSNTQKYSLERTGLKMFTCIDEEGGRVARIGNNTAFPVETFPDMAYINGEDEAYHVGDTIGSYLSKYGFNVDFAPCADVITNSENKVIGTRSFGTDSGIVSKMSLSVARGLKGHGILVTYKHFPGHGATVGDTHEGFAYTDKTLQELIKDELVPFKSAADNGIDMVMVAHISVPNVIGDNTPCSLSYKMITGVLKEQLGFKGLIVTDALNMGAIANQYASETAAVMAVKAGNDLLLMPKNFTAAAQAIVDEVRSGNISEERINESVRKIVRAKLQL